MSVPGWYPDPEGRPGHVRYWDGSRWGPLAVGSTEPPRRRSWAGVALVASVVAIVVGLAALIAPRVVGALAPPPSPTPIPTQSDGPLPGSPTPTFPFEEQSLAPTLNPWDSCPVLVNAGPAADQAADSSTLSSAGLTFTVPDGWQPTRATVSMVLLEQAAALSYVEDSSWFNFMLSGSLPKDLGFFTTEDAAAAVTQCHITSASFSGFVGFEVEESGEVVVDGHPGWRQRVTAQSTRAPGGGAVYEAVVLDTGLPGGFSVFWAGAVLSDTQATADLLLAEQSLRVS